MLDEILEIPYLAQGSVQVGENFAILSGLGWGKVKYISTKQIPTIS